MFQIKKSIILCCILLMTALVFATTTSYVQSDGGSILIKETNAHGGLDRSNTIEASINGHTLSIVFTQNIGHVTVEVATDTGTPVDSQSLATPDSAQFYIAATGNYVFTITLSNGDEYYGEFSVTD